MLLLQIRSADKITLLPFIKDFGLTRPRADAGDFNCFLLKKKKRREKKIKRAFEKFTQDMLKPME